MLYSHPSFKFLIYYNNVTGVEKKINNGAIYWCMLQPRPKRPPVQHKSVFTTCGEPVVCRGIRRKLNVTPRVTFRLLYHGLHQVFAYNGRGGGREESGVGYLFPAARPLLLGTDNQLTHSTAVCLFVRLQHTKELLSHIIL